MLGPLLVHLLRDDGPLLCRAKRALDGSDVESAHEEMNSYADALR